MPTLTSSQLTLLVEIGRTGSLARAALNLNVTPPAISQQLARIEKDMGVALVERGARGARLTPLGELLAEHGKLVADELGRAEETAAQFIGAHVNRLRIGAPPSMCVKLLPDVLAAIRYQFPRAELSVVDVMSDAGSGLVAEGHLDLALSASYGGPTNTDRVTLHPLLSDKLAVVLPDDHRLSTIPATKIVDLSELSNEAWVSGPPGRPSRTQLDDAAAELGFVPYVPFETESYDVAQALAGAGVAVALIPLLALTNLGTTCVRPLEPPLAREVFAVLPSSDDHIPLARHFLARLRQVAATYEP
jgi:DNA-binding transcriptional LysR family regulator